MAFHKQFSIGMLAAVAALSLSASQARADFLVNPVSATFNSGAGDWTYTYSIALTPGSELDSTGGGLNSGNYMTIYAIPGLEAGTLSLSASVASVFTGSVQTPGVDVPLEMSHNTPGLENITLTYVSPLEIDLPAGSTNLVFGTFSFNSLGAPSPTPNLFYVGATQTNDPDQGNDEQEANNTARLTGPTTPVAQVPAPAAFLLMLTGLPALGFFARRRKTAS